MSMNLKALSQLHMLCVFRKLVNFQHYQCNYIYHSKQAKHKFNALQAKQAESEYCRLAEALVAEKEKEFRIMPEVVNLRV